jgi:hypothetical protein
MSSTADEGLFGEKMDCEKSSERLASLLKDLDSSIAQTSPRKIVFHKPVHDDRFCGGRMRTYDSLFIVPYRVKC